MLPRALTIAGSDSGGGAGIQADLKTFHAHGVYGACALSLVTVQNTLGVESVHLLPPDLVTAQIAAVARDLGCDAAKTGALGNAALIRAVAAALREHRIRPLVVDPVLVSKHGHALAGPDAVAALREELLPLADLITPNLFEAEALLGSFIPDEAAMRTACRDLLALGPRAVLLKGGSLPGEEVVDLLAAGGEITRLASPRLATRHTHGTGCTYSAAITALLARGAPLAEAVPRARAYLLRAIAAAPGLGSGAGPVNHLVAPE